MSLPQPISLFRLLKLCFAHHCSPKDWDSTVWLISGGWVNVLKACEAPLALPASLSPGLWFQSLQCLCALANLQPSQGPVNGKRSVPTGLETKLWGHLYLLSFASKGHCLWPSDDISEINCMYWLNQPSLQWRSRMLFGFLLDFFFSFFFFCFSFSASG